MAELILRSGKRAGRRIPLPSSEVVVGRDEGCHIRLTSSEISRRHCLLRCDGEVITAADLGSRNGTHVNGAPIRGPIALRPGDLLRIGPFLFQVPGGGEAQTSDADINGWLTEEGTLTGGRPSNVANDTALVPEISGKDTTELKLTAAGPEGRAESASPATPAASAESDDPVVAQAAAIIREYHGAKKRR